MSKRESKKAASPLLRPAILSVTLSLLLVVIIAMLGGILILKGVLPEAATGIVAILAVFLGALVGPLPLIKASGKKRLPTAYAVAGILLALLLLAKWLVWPEEHFTNWWVLLAGLAGATLAGLLQAKKKKYRR